MIARTPEVIYEMVSDVTRMGEWSPVCTACRWDEGDAPRVGAWFTGSNELGGRAWDTRCEVEVADPGREFAFVVGGIANGRARWGYRFAAADGGTEVTESWQVLPGWLANFEDKTDDEIREMLATREKWARAGMPATLAALKQAAEASA
jgi:hypothetical protein